MALPLATISPGPATAVAAPHHAVARAAGRMTPAIGNPVKFRRAGRVTKAMKAAASASTVPTFGCQSADAPVKCYGPAQIRAAYNVPGRLTGAGRTIVIIDAFQSPTIGHDLATFDTLFQLPTASLNIIAPDGLTPFDPANADQVNWAGEITLDVEWAHAIAPGATIDLVLSKSDNDADILSAQKFVVDHNLGDTLSQSFGEGETCMDPALLAQGHRLFAKAAAEKMTVFASSGDDGSAQADCNGDGNFFESVSTPASDPWVTGVGGTHLNADLTTGAYGSETTWNDEFGSSGGGFSTIYPRPVYQFGLHTPNHHRGVPDVSYNADVDGGVLGVFSSSGLGTDLVFIFGGTSAGSPQWAGITALADQAAHHRVGFINTKLYALSHNALVYRAVFHDITVGTNIWEPSGVTAGFSAGPGWDAVTGLGSPNVRHLIPLLAAGL
ncbi:MAG: S53 family peptidase [Actinomycetota bacterium]